MCKCNQTGVTFRQVGLNLLHARLQLIGVYIIYDLKSLSGKVL